MSMLIDQDLLFPAEERARAIARGLYAGVKDLPIVSPHGHTDPRWYALNEPFPDPAQLLIVPDHYIFRMLFSQGVRLEDLGVPTLDGSPVETDGRKIWRLFAEHYHLFRGTPTRLWFDYVLSDLFGIDEPLSAGDRRPRTTTRSPSCLQRDAYPPARAVRALQHRGDRHHRRRARRSEMARDDPRQRLERAASSPPIGRTRSSIRISRALPPISTGSARSPAATPAPGPAISTRIASAAPTSRSSARPRPITAIRPPRPPTSPMPRPRSCSTASGAARRTSASSGCSAPRC